MAYISLRTFQPKFHVTDRLSRHAVLAFAGLWSRYQAFRQRRQLAGLSMLELKDIGYPVDEPPADLAARRGSFGQGKRR